MSLNQEVMTQWADALESGEYEQCSGMLRSEVDSFCCLGVLSELAVKAGVIEPPTRMNAFGYGYGESATSSVLPQEVGEWAGVKVDPVFVVDTDGLTDTTSAISLNDGEKATFQQIANLIRSGAIQPAPDGWYAEKTV